MIINTNAQEDVVAQGLAESTNFSIKASAAAFQLLSSGLYTNKIKAVLREIGCNGVDAHVLNGNQQKPIDVKLPNKLDNQFYIRDYGPGLSHEQIMKLYATYFDSTKQADNNLIGGFGVGSKSPFAYTDSFTIVAIHEGVSRTYIAYTDDEGLPVISLAGESPSDEPSGLQIGFPVKPSDIREFEQEAIAVYSGFKVTPRILGSSLDIESRKPVQLVGPVFVNPDRYTALSVNMGGVIYPVGRLSDEQLNPMNLSGLATLLLREPLVIDVPIGSLSVAASREALQFNKVTLNGLKNVLEDAATAIRSKYLELFQEIDPSIPTVGKATALQEKLKSDHLHRWLTNLPDTDPLLQNKELKEAVHIIKHGTYNAEITDHTKMHAFELSSNFSYWMRDRSQTYDIDDYTERKAWNSQIQRLWTRNTMNASITRRDRNDIFAQSSKNIFYMPPSGPVLKPLEINIRAQVNVVRLNKPLGPDVLLELSQQRKMFPSDRHVIFLAPPNPNVDPKEFNDAADALIKEYQWTETPRVPLPELARPERAKKATVVRTKEDWFVLPRKAVEDESTLDATRKALRTYVHGGYQHYNALKESKFLYVPFDRVADKKLLPKTASEQATADALRTTSLYKAIENTKISENVLSQLRTGGYPSTVVFVEKEHLDKFLDKFPESTTWEELKKDLQSDPVLLGKEKTWFESRPTIRQLSWYDNRFMDSVKPYLSELEDHSLLKQTMDLWAKSNSDNFNRRVDESFKDFFNEVFGRQYQSITTQSTEDEMKLINERYPYLVYLANASNDIRKDYVLQQDTAHQPVNYDPYTMGLF